MLTNVLTADQLTTKDTDRAKQSKKRTKGKKMTMSNFLVYRTYKMLEFPETKRDLRTK